MPSLLTQTLVYRLCKRTGIICGRSKPKKRELYDEIQTLFEPVVTRPGWSAPPIDFRQAQTVEKSHGRREKRRITVSSELSNYSTWPYVAQVFKLESQRTDALGRTQIEVRYDVTSLP